MIVHPNKNISRIERKGSRKVIHFTTGTTYDVPIDAPEVDPYDKTLGNGFMCQNAILDSNLSNNAKLMYAALRRHVCYETGYVSVTQQTLAKTMSVSVRTLQETARELEACNIVRVENSTWGGHKKNYYYLQHEKSWRMPNERTPKMSASKKRTETKPTGLAKPDKLAPDKDEKVRAILARLGDEERDFLELERRPEDPFMERWF